MIGEYAYLSELSLEQVLDRLAVAFDRGHLGWGRRPRAGRRSPLAAADSARAARMGHL